MITFITIDYSYSINFTDLPSRAFAHTCKVVKLRQGFHDDANERQIEHSDPCFDLRVSIAGVRIMAGQQVMDHADHLLMQAKHPTDKQEFCETDMSTDSHQLT